MFREATGDPALYTSRHKTEAIYRRYDIEIERDLMEAGQKMERFLAERVTVTFENPEPNQGEGNEVRKALN